MQSSQYCKNWTAKNFSGLKGVDGKTYTLADITGEKGTVIMFICNHCPYVIGIIDRLIKDMKKLQSHGIGVVAIMPNDVNKYPADSFENMQYFAKKHRFSFPYLIDKTQEVAKAYDAVCTPDFFGFDSNLKLKYRGRLDSSGKNPATSDTKHELVEAMITIATTGNYPNLQVPSMGCSIKWQEDSAH